MRSEHTAGLYHNEVRCFLILSQQETAPTPLLHHCCTTSQLREYMRHVDASGASPQNSHLPHVIPSEATQKNCDRAFNYGGGRNTGVYPEGLEIPLLTFADRGHVFLFVVVVFSAMKLHFPLTSIGSGIIRSGCTLWDMKGRNNLSERGRLWQHTET